MQFPISIETNHYAVNLNTDILQKVYFGHVCVTIKLIKRIPNSVKGIIGIITENKIIKNCCVSGLEQLSIRMGQNIFNFCVKFQTLTDYLHFNKNLFHVQLNNNERPYDLLYKSNIFFTTP